MTRPRPSCVFKVLLFDLSILDTSPALAATGDAKPAPGGPRTIERGRVGFTGTLGLTSPGQASTCARRHAHQRTGTTRCVAPRSVRLSSADRVLFPDDGITKGDLFDYYGRADRGSSRTSATGRSR